MANSKIFDILNEVENGRKKCLRNARMANLDVYDSMSLNTIADLFLQKNTPSYIDDFQRPDDWPNIETILTEAEPRLNDMGETVYPSYICLLNNSFLTTTLNDNRRRTYSGDGYLLSDGTWYGNSNSNIIHTWDMSKDIPCDKGYGTRWIMMYLKENSNNRSIMFDSGSTVLEVIFGKGIGTFSFSEQNNTNYACRFIKRVKVLDNSDYIPASSSAFCGTTIEYLELNKLNTSSNDFNNLFSLRYLIIKDNNSIKNFSVAGCLNLKTVSIPNLITANGTFNNCYNLMSVDLPNLETISNAFSNCYNLRSLYLPKVKTISGGNGSGFIRCYLLEEIICPKLEQLNTSYGFQQTNSLRKMTIPDTLNRDISNDACFPAYLTELIIPENFHYNLNISGCQYMTHDSLMNIINNLCETNSTLTLKLGTSNLAKLTPEEIQIATDKGWTIN